MTSGFFGPFEPDDLTELLKSVTGEAAPNDLGSLLKAIQERRADQDAMSQQASVLKIRLFIEGLTDDQLHDFAWLVASMIENEHFPHVIKGLVVADNWRRHPLESMPDGGA